MIGYPVIPVFAKQRATVRYRCVYVDWALSVSDWALTAEWLHGVRVLSFRPWRWIGAEEGGAG